MYYAHTIFRGIGAYSPDFLSIVQFGVFWSTFSVNFVLRKYIDWRQRSNILVL